ncbi:MAG: YtxH domain-containing protein [Chloroflexota bacterium]|nr:YtxH domain-containing protein [Chloroflexota bacterium]
MSRLVTALRWFAYGLALGILFAPRSGQETRRQLIQSVSTYLSQAFSSGGQALNQAAQQASQATQQAGQSAQQASDQVTQSRVQVQESSGSSSTTFGGGPA